MKKMKREVEERMEKEIWRIKKISMIRKWK